MLIMMMMTKSGIRFQVFTVMKIRMVIFVFTRREILEVTGRINLEDEHLYKTEGWVVLR